MPDGKAVPSPPLKAVMFFDGASAADGYGGDVFLHDSRNGVTRMSFVQYLNRVSQPHEGEYRLVKLCLGKLNGDRLLLADVEYIRSNAKCDALGPSKSDVRCRLDMAFRAVWYAATGGEDLMPI